MKIVRKFWADEAGIIVSTEIILVVLLLVLGLLAGMASLRDAVASELGDLGEAINNLDGSYQFAGNVYSADQGNNTTETPSSGYVDDADANQDQSADLPPDGMVMDGALNSFNVDGEDGT